MDLLFHYSFLVVYLQNGTLLCLILITLHSQGPQGVQGTAGAPGLAGEKGAAGDPGNEGERGKQVSK